MAAISQTIFSGVSSWMKSFVYDLTFIEACSQGSNWKYLSIGWDKISAPNRGQAIVWTNADPIQCHIYAERGGRWVNHPCTNYTNCDVLAKPPLKPYQQSATLEPKSCRDDCFGHRGRRWRQTSTSPMTINDFTLWTFAFLCIPPMQTRQHLLVHVDILFLKKKIERYLSMFNGIHFNICES